MRFAILHYLSLTCLARRYVARLALWMTSWAPACAAILKPETGRINGFA
jgi:hypothetical protein